MSKTLLLRWICAALLLLTVVASVPKPLTAAHGWRGGYHWPRTTSAIKDIPIDEYHSAIWLARYATAVADWRKPALTKIRLKHSLNGTPKSTFAGCPRRPGRVSSCDGFYGNTNWLGLGGFGYSGIHVVFGISWVNNTYFVQSSYNNVPWRQLVICQEIGHALTLGHVNVNNNNRNTGSCMDYTRQPAGGGSFGPNNMHPNAHDYVTLNGRHNHLPSLLPGFTPEHSEGAEPAEQVEQAELSVSKELMEFNPMQISDMGRLVSITDGGRTEQYVKDFGNDQGFVSYVIRAK